MVPGKAWGYSASAAIAAPKAGTRNDGQSAGDWGVLRHVVSLADQQHGSETASRALKYMTWVR
jgi:hypothetical protein